MKKLIILISALFVFIGISGCATKAAFIYETGTNLNLTKNKKPLTIAVIPLIDLRKTDNHNYSLLGFIPLVPFGWFEYNRPEAANGFLFQQSFNFRPSEDIAKAIVSELQVNQLFEEVFFTFREKEPNVDYFLTGELYSTYWDGSLITYCLSSYGSLLWLVGLPVGTVNNELSLKLFLRKSSNWEVVWSDEIKGNYGKTVGFYYNWASDFDGYSEILKKGLNESLKKLALKLPEL
ncbi:MAG: hypothetical protein V1779_02150 [bacterium]